MTYQEIYGDVTKTMPGYVTAHCISEDCAMGAGVVLAFRKAFPGLKAACMEYVQSATHDQSAFHGEKPTSIFMMPGGFLAPYRHHDEGKTVYNMFTKKRYYQKAGKGISYATYLQNLEESLVMVKQMMVSHGEEKIAMPKIGSGLDRCKWDDVKKIIIDVFHDTDIEVLICNFD